MLSVGVLGPVEVRRDGELLAVPAGKPTELLVRLVLAEGAPATADRLLEDLWGEAATIGRNTLQTKVSQLRRALGDPGAVVAASGGYAVPRGTVELDSQAVVDLAREATGARRGGDPATAARRAEAALALFRGEVLAGLGDEPWVRAHRTRLEEVRLGLVEDHVAARVDLGEERAVIGELEALVAAHPLREGLWASLVTALYRAGRQADALAAYGRVRSILVEELGLEPGPALHGLEGQILRQSAELDVVVGTDPDPVEISGAAEVPPRSDLPIGSTPLVGRDPELADLERLLVERRLVTVVGPAGVGKTRLVLEAAVRARPAGGVHLVRLDAATAEGPLDRFLAESLDVPGGTEAVAARVGGAPTLLVLDNCEHVAPAVAEVVGALLRAAPGLTVLCSSQVPLGIEDEAVVVLEPLSPEASVELFLDRASEARPRFRAEDDAAATVAEICRSLDGLPLAIELAAARVRSLSVAEIARRLDDRFTLLHDPTSQRPARRRTLAAAIAWSYDLLFPDDQRGLWALSVFADGASLDALEQVLASLEVPTGALLDVIGRLVDRSLVTLDDHDGDLRYRLLDSIGAFAGERLRESGQEEVARAALAAWVAERAARCASDARTSTQPACVAFARRERADVDAVLGWCTGHDPALGGRIVLDLAWTWVVLGDGAAGADRVRAALGAAGERLPAAERAAGLLDACWLEASAGDVAQAQTDADAAIALLAAAGVESGSGAALHLAFLRIQQGRPTDALESAGVAATAARATEDDWRLGAGLVLGAFARMILGDVAGAERDGQEALEVVNRTGDEWGLVHAAAMLGTIAEADHRLDDAARAMEAAADASERLGFLGQAALHRANLGRVQRRAGDLDAATATLTRALAAADRAGDARMAALTRVDLARVLRSRDQQAEARRLLVGADRWFRQAGGGDGALLARCLLLALERPDDPVVLGELEELVEAAQAAHDAPVEVLASDAVARRRAEAGDTAGAAAALAAADARMAEAAHLVDPADRVDASAIRSLVER